MIPLIIISLFSKNLHAYTCNKKIDDKKVIFMTAFHGAGVELEGAEKGACERGEKLVTYPDKEYLMRYSAHKKELNMDKLKTEFDKLNREYNNCTIKAKAYDSCDALLKKLDEVELKAQEAETKMYKWSKDNGPKYSAQVALENLAKKMQAEKGVITSMVISGHDGGGEYYGDDHDQSISKDDIFKLAGTYPEQLKGMNSVILMGCWSAVPKEVDEWKVNFPSIKVIGGFVGSAPSSDRIASGTFIEDSLKLYPSLQKNRDAKNAEKLIKSIKNIGMINSGVYVDLSKTNCSEVVENKNQYFYISPAISEDELADNTTNGEKGFHPFVSIYSSKAQVECKRFSDSMNWDLIGKYFSGELVAENNKDLKDAYSKLRNNEHCGNYHFLRFAPDTVFFLRFFPDLRKNFAKYFKQEIISARKEIDELLSSKDISDAKKETIKNNINIDLLSPENIASMDRSKLSRLLSGIESVLYWGRDAKSTDALKNLKIKLDKHLYRMECIDPTWHEYIDAAKLPPPSC